MGVSTSSLDRGAQGSIASQQQPPMQSADYLIAQLSRQLAINWNTFDREFQTICVELLNRILFIAGDDTSASSGLLGAATNSSFGPSFSAALDASLQAVGGTSSSSQQPQVAPTQNTLSGRALFSQAQPARSASTNLSSSFPGPRAACSGGLTFASLSSSSGAGPLITTTTPSHESCISTQDLEALAVAVLALEADGFFALVESMAFIVTGQTRRERQACHALTPTNSSTQQGQTSSAMSHSDAPSRAQPSSGSVHSGSSQRFASSAVTSVNANTQSTSVSRGNSAPIGSTMGAMSYTGSGPTSTLLSHSQDSPFRAATSVQLHQLQKQQEQMRFAPTSFGDHAYNNTLLMSMSARSSNSDFHTHTRSDSRQASAAHLGSSHGSGSVFLVPSRHPRRGSSLDNMSAIGLTSPIASRMLTPHAPSAFANSVTGTRQFGASSNASTFIAAAGASASRPNSRRPSFASGTRPVLSAAGGSMVSMSSAALAELPHNHQTAAALTYIAAEHTFQYSDKLSGHSQQGVLKSLNALLAHLHIPEHSVTALWVMFFEVLCDVQECVNLSHGAGPLTVLNPAAMAAIPTPPTSVPLPHIQTSLSTHGNSLLPVATGNSLSSADDTVLMSPGAMQVAPSTSTTGAGASGSAIRSPMSASCCAVVVPVVEKLVLPHYSNACRVLEFAGGCGRDIVNMATVRDGTRSPDHPHDRWTDATETVSEPRAASMETSTRAGAVDDARLRHTLSGGLPSLPHDASGSVQRSQQQVPTAQSRQVNNYLSNTGSAGSPPPITHRAARGGSGGRRSRGWSGTPPPEDTMIQRAQQYFRDECTMLVGCGSGAAKPSRVANTASTSSISSTSVTPSRGASSTALIADPLVQKTAFVLHYAERISLNPGDSPASSVSAPSGPTVVSLWQMRTRLVSLRQHYLYVYDAMASTIALLGGDLNATVALPSADVQLNAPIAVMDLAGAAGSDLRVVSGPSDAEVMPVRASRTSRGRPAQSDPFFAVDEHHNAELHKGTRSEDTTVYRVQNEEGELFLLVLPVAGRSSGAGPEQDAITATATELEQRLSRPGVLSLMPNDAGNGGVGGAAPLQSFTRVQGDEHVALSVHPLRILYQGVLHHFFFQNANVRAQWFDHIVATTTMMQSRKQVIRVATSPQHLSQFLHRRISYPVGPAAFEYIDMLGVGGFGRVLLVRHKLAGRLFAMKIIRKFKFHGMRNVVEVRRECNTLRSVDCPYIMKIHTIFQTDSRVYILLDYLPGGELLVHTQQTKAHHFDEDTARFFVAELAIALESLRVQGIVHRDLKGDNVVLDADGHAVLTDFGFAKKIVEDDPVAAQQARALEASHSSGEPRRADDDRHPRGRLRWQHSSCGTLAYLAPEVLQRTPPRNGYGLEADWWSLGVVLFTMLTGYFPFLKEDNDTTKRAIVTSPLQFPPRVALTDGARDLMKRLMEKDPMKRISSLALMKKHPYFRGFDWAACEERRLRPPVLLHKDMYKTASSGSSAARRLRDTVVAILEHDQLHRNDNDNDSESSMSSSSSERDTTAAPRAIALPTEVTPNKKYALELQEEIDELKLVEKAFGPDTMPVPTTLEEDVFGPLYAFQEECGSDREDLVDEDTPVDASMQRGGGMVRAMSTSWFDPSDGTYIPAVNYTLPYAPPGLHDAIGSGALRRAQERENAFVDGTALSASQDQFAMSGRDGDFFPLINDFDEAAYMSMQDVRSTDARLASDATGLFRPLIPGSSAD